MDEKRIRLSGGELVYLEIGNGRPLVFFHGAIATPQAYLPLLTLLAKYFRVIAPTHPGHGDSFETPDGWMLENFVRCYEEFLGSLGLTTPVMIGHSFGGTLALLLAAKHRASRVIALDPAGLPITLTLRSFLLAKKKEVQEILERRDKTQMQEVALAAKTLLYTARRHPKELSWFLTKGPKLDISTQLATVSVPTIIFWGADDGIIPLSVGEKMHQLIPGSHLTVFPNWGHNYAVFEPERTFEELMRVL